MPGQSSSQLYSTFDNSTFLPLVIHSLCKFSNWPDTGADHSHSGITKHVARKLLSCSVFFLSLSLSLSLLFLIWSLLVLYGLHFPIGHWDRTTLDDDLFCWNVKDHRETDINARDFIRWLWCLAGWLLGIVCHQLHQQYYHYYLNYPWPSAHRHCFFYCQLWPVVVRALIQLFQFFLLVMEHHQVKTLCAPDVNHVAGFFAPLQQ